MARLDSPPSFATSKASVPTAAKSELSNVRRQRS
jgi:hypothetical protein